MSGHALEVLEFERVLERVAQRASSELGRERVLALSPRTDRAEVVRELERVAAVLDFLEERPDWSLGAVPDLGATLAELRAEGAVLEAKALHLVGSLLNTSRLLKEALPAQAVEGPLAATASRLLALRPIEDEIARSVDPEGGVLSTASRDLKRIRDRLRGAHGKVVRALEKYLASIPSQYVVPDASVTIREGRYVVSIRREGKSEVGGIVHGESQTGATIFVEPPIAIELMNGLRDLEGEEAREVHRILRALTASLTPHADALAGVLDALVEFDALQARARTARRWNGVVPEIAEPGERALRIREGRHPLLLEGAEAAAVVPFDLDLEADERALVVSGPNTGGKSVFLKASGLVVALAQSGVVPPVGPGTRLPVFMAIFADIGDEQSIARNLSTFSAHLANLSDIVAKADETSLVLIDEMGTGTDPAEGAALARAVLEELVVRGATTLVTSHLGELKKLDTEGSGIVNASLQFDADRIEPTYRLVKGRPGRSYGLAIARKLGFPGDVLDRAEAHRERGAAELEELLGRLEREEQAARELAHRLDLERAETARLRADLEDRERAVRQAERTAETRARDDARRLLLEARAEVEEAIRTLQGAVDGGASLDDAAREARSRVERAARRQKERAPDPAPPQAPPTLTPGARVRIGATGARGRVLELRDDRALVEAGPLRIEVPVHELEVTAGAESGGSGATRRAPADDGAESGRPHGRSWSGPVPEPRIEVDLRGLRVEEMEAELTKALDEASLGDLPELRIIHGKGTGALRKRVSEMLEGDGRVSEFRMGAPQEGGAGVTVARFRR